MPWAVLKSSNQQPLVPPRVLRAEARYRKVSMSKKTIVSSIPDCDICILTHNPPTKAYADCFIPGYHTWGNVCKMHFNSESCELGTGKGQVFELQDPTDKLGRPLSQTDRIKQALKDTDLNDPNLSMQDFEDIFEDRDPAEFL